MSCIVSRSAQASRSIDAPIEEVWKVLTGIDNYSSWNPFVTNIVADSTVPTPGVQMTFTVVFPDQSVKTTKELNQEYDPPQQAEGSYEYTSKWVYTYDSWPSYLNMTKAIRVQTLTQKPGGPTEYFSKETYTGWLIWAIPLKQVQGGFDAQADALKSTCEEQAKQSSS